VPIWGEFRVSWRNVLPPVLVVTALACLALSLRSCLWPGSDNAPRDEVLEQYRRQLDSADPGIVVASIRLLGELGDLRAVEPIRLKLKAEDPRIVGAALAALGRLGDESVTDTLLDSLRRNDPAVLAGAAEGLGALKVKPAVEPLSSLLGSGDYSVRLAAIVALGKMGDPAAEAALSKLQSNPSAGLSPAPSEEERSRLDEALRTALGQLGNPK
jgi:HEAT repeat protein